MSFLHGGEAAAVHRPQRFLFRTSSANSSQFGFSACEVGADGRIDHQIKNKEYRAVMDIFAFRAMSSMFRRKSISEKIFRTSDTPRENHSSTAVENLSIEQVKRRWRRKQIKNQEKQSTYIDSSWRLKQIWDWTLKPCNMQNNSRGNGFFEGNPAGIQRDNMEIDANPSDHLPKRHSICMSPSSIWQRSRSP
jgi:hypothetical protein